MIRNATNEDAAAISDIYNYYITNTTVTFEETPVTADQMTERMREVQSKYPWLVYETDGKVTGYAYGSTWKPRAAYRNTAEISVYLHPEHTGKGTGKKLYGQLLQQMKNLNLHLLIGGVALPNEASVRLHEGFGFKKIGQFSEVGLKFGQWVDVGYWELHLAERKIAVTAELGEADRKEQYY